MTITVIGKYEIKGVTTGESVLDRREETALEERRRSKDWKGLMMKILKLSRILKGGLLE